MEVRPINGSWDNFLLNLSFLTLKDFQENRAGLNSLKTAVVSQPTLTPPNDLLTCEGCDMQGEKVTPCTSCIRDPRVCDYYTACRPPEGEGNA